MGNSAIWAWCVLFSIPALCRSDFGAHPTSFLHSKQPRFSNHRQKLRLPCWHHSGYFLRDDKRLPSEPLMVFSQAEWYFSVNDCSTLFERSQSYSAGPDKMMHGHILILCSHKRSSPSCFYKQTSKKINPPTLCYTSVSQSDWQLQSSCHQGNNHPDVSTIKRKDLKRVQL